MGGWKGCSLSKIVKLVRLTGIYCLTLSGLLFAAHPPCGSDATPRVHSEPVSPLVCDACLDTATYAALLLDQLKRIRQVNSLMERSSKVEEDLVKRASLAIEEMAELRALGTEWRR